MLVGLAVAAGLPWTAAPARAGLEAVIAAAKPSVVGRRHLQADRQAALRLPRQRLRHRRRLPGDHQCARPARGAAARRQRRDARGGGAGAADEANRLRAAQLLVLDRAHDLALPRIDGPALALPAASAGDLNPQAVSRLRSGSFDIYQLDATAYPGNSGGPVIDVESGRVIAVINMVLVKGSKETALQHPSGISYAVPIRFTSELPKSR